MRSLTTTIFVLNIAYCIWGLLNHSYAPRQVSNAQQMEGEMVGRRVLMPSEVKQDISGVYDKRADELVGSSSDEDLCYEVGPIVQARTVDVVGLLSGLKNVTVEARESQSLGKTYWVYLKGSGSNDMLEEKQKELLDKKIDSFVITEGELAHSISLGIFDKQENAIKRKGELTSLGYQVEIKEVVKSVDDAWVSVRSSKSSQIIQEVNENVLQQKLSGFGKLEIRKFDCQHNGQP